MDAKYIAAMIKADKCGKHVCNCVMHIERPAYKHMYRDVYPDVVKYIGIQYLGVVIENNCLSMQFGLSSRIRDMYPFNIVHVVSVSLPFHGSVQLDTVNLDEMSSHAIIRRCLAFLRPEMERMQTLKIRIKSDDFV